jgi:hypothetical protein
MESTRIIEELDREQRGEQYSNPEALAKDLAQEYQKARVRAALENATGDVAVRIEDVLAGRLPPDGGEPQEPLSSEKLAQALVAQQTGSGEANPKQLAAALRSKLEHVLAQIRRPEEASGAGADREPGSLAPSSAPAALAA